MSAKNWTFTSLSNLHDLFQWEEYVVLSSVLLLSVLIGVYFAWRGQKSTDEYLNASKQMTLFPMTMSLACR